jgi:hypothetical protein
MRCADQIGQTLEMLFGLPLLQQAEQALHFAGYLKRVYPECRESAEHL